jgi:hypothetical protein
MTEQEWLACADPEKMLGFLRGKASDRKLRLFAVACCRELDPESVASEPARIAVEVAERFADRQAAEGELAASGGAAARDAVYVARVAAGETRAGTAAWGAAWAVCGRSVSAVAAWAASAAWGCEPGPRADRLRDLFGNPFRPAIVSPAWRTPQVLALAQAAYEHRDLPAGTLDVARLAILADALEDAGCDRADLLAHLRRPGPHVRGCWAVDLILGKS